MEELIKKYERWIRRLDKQILFLCDSIIHNEKASRVIIVNDLKVKREKKISKKKIFIEIVEDLKNIKL